MSYAETKASPILDQEQKEKVLEVRAKEWDKPVSLWKKMHFDKGKVSFVGKK